MGHGHDHDHGTADVGTKVLVGAIGLNVLLTVFQVFAGILSGSAALLADALHNGNDAAALGIAYGARRIGKRASDKRFTFGYRRAELIGAMINLTALIVIGVFLLIEAIKRFLHPEPVVGQWMVIAAAVAVVIDVGTAWLLWAKGSSNMNMKAVFLHNATDAAASVAVLAGGLGVMWFGWMWVDPALTLLIAGYILYSSIGMLKGTSAILMEGTPEGLDVETIRQELEAIEGVDNIHHLHVWGLDEDHRALEAHVCVQNTEIQTLEGLKSRLKTCLHDRFDISHTTLEFEAPDSECSERALLSNH